MAPPGLPRPSRNRASHLRYLVDIDRHGAEKSLQKLFQDRLHWLDEYDKLTVAQKRAASPDASPENQAAQAKAELKTLNEMLSQAASAPESLLPPSFSRRQQSLPACSCPR